MCLCFSLAFGALFGAPPSLVARRRLLAPQSRRRRAPPARCVSGSPSGRFLGHRLPSSLVAGSSLLSPGGAAPLRLALAESDSVLICPGCEVTAMEDAAGAARRMWTLFEPVHVVTYFSAEALSAFIGAGLRGFWRGYFAGRAAPLGAVGAAPVTASFFNFAPPMVARALPAVWELITPEDALAVRSAGAVSALRRLLGGQEAAVAAAADGLLRATDGLDCAGRVLAAANAARPVPGEPAARLWYAATLLREHRGDAHFAALLAADIDGCEALVLRTGSDRKSVV